MIDQNAGMGGSYLLDEKTGARTLVERTDDVDCAPEPDLSPVPEPDPEPVAEQRTATYPPQ